MEFVCCTLPLLVGVQNITLETTCAKCLVEMPEIDLGEEENKTKMNILRRRRKKGVKS